MVEILDYSEFSHSLSYKKLISNMPAAVLTPVKIKKLLYSKCAIPLLRRVMMDPSGKDKR